MDSKLKTNLIELAESHMEKYFKYPLFIEIEDDEDRSIKRKFILVYDENPSPDIVEKEDRNGTVVFVGKSFWEESMYFELVNNSNYIDIRVCDTGIKIQPSISINSRIYWEQKTILVNNKIYSLYVDVPNDRLLIFREIPETIAREIERNVDVKTWELIEEEQREFYEEDKE